jgi:hypothetical protein
MKTTFVEPVFPRLITADGEQAALPPDVRERIERAWAVQAQLEALKAELDAHKAMLQHILPAGGRAEIPGLCAVSLTQRTTVTIGDATRLSGVLGALWPECVIEQVDYKPTPALIDLSADADSPLANPIRECLTVKTVTALTLKPLRPAKADKAKKAK